MASKLRILVPSFPAADSFTDNVVYTLRQLGHDVRCMEALSFRDQGPIQRALSDVFHGLRPDTLSAQERWALAQAKDWKPDLLLCLTIAIRSEVLADLKRLGVGVCIAWWGDPPANMKGMGLLADGWDMIFIKDPAAAKKLKAVGLQAELLHEAANPDWHRPISVSGHPDVGAVVVAGNYYGYRQFLVTRLAETGTALALYGPKPPRWSTDAVRTQHRMRYIVREEKSKAFYAGLACLNSTAMSEGDSLNCRAFEICGIGGLQLIENKSAVELCYEPGNEVLTYSSVDEILDYLDRARKEPDWTKKIREAGVKRTVSEHTYRHRLDYILRECGLMQ
ncbi:CgeB family protein [Marinobacter alexandrii]|uniref:CgeB family protein n=1 Tax=Marinobacter alexandrii TaxID=2570351 RepID=UPI003298B337